VAGTAVALYLVAIGVTRAAVGKAVDRTGRGRTVAVPLAAMRAALLLTLWVGASLTLSACAFAALAGACEPPVPPDRGRAARRLGRRAAADRRRRRGRDARAGPSVPSPCWGLLGTLKRDRPRPATPLGAGAPSPNRRRADHHHRHHARAQRLVAAARTGGRPRWWGRWRTAV